MDIRLQTLVLTSLSLGACGGAAEQQAATEPAAAPQPFQDDTAILARIYDPFYRVPDDFFRDERADTPRSYTVHHVKDQSLSYELCSDDFYEAERLEALDNESRAVNGYYVGAYENGRYFEFIRELSYSQDVGGVADVTSPGFGRVFKCSAVDRIGVDRNLRDGYAGTLNVRPLTASAVRNFTEYLWQFTFFEAGRKKVLDAYSTESTDAHQHTLVLGLATSQGAGRCDRIEIVDWVFRVNKSSGEIHKTFNVLRTFEARSVDGAYERC